MAEFSNRIVVITGAGKGIGRAAAHRFAAAGATVVVAARTVSEIESTADQIREQGGRAHALLVDIADPVSITDLFAQVEARCGQLDCLVNNAAVAGTPGRAQLDLEQMQVEDWDHVFAVNVRGAMLCCQAAVPLLCLSDNASIINVSSTAARVGIDQRSHYCASKAALLGLTRALAQELGARRIRVNCVVPGMTRTELLDKFFQQAADQQASTVDEIVEAAATDSPLGELASPEQVADTMLFLASTAGSAMTGQTLDPNMGSFMA